MAQDDLGGEPVNETEPRLFADRKLHLLVEQAPAIIWTTDTDLRFTSALGAGLEALSVQPGEWDVGMAEALGASDSTFASISAHDRALRGQSSSYAATWEGRLYECRIEPLQLDGEIVGCIGVAVDVSDRRRAELHALVAYEEAIQCIVRATELRDIVTGEHVERMSHYCALLCEKLDLPPEDRHAIPLAARLHDIGKIAVPDGILLKSGQLTDDERTIMERHCAAGHKLLAASASQILQLAAEVALYHHEWYDGSGYPHGLKEHAIPLPARIAAIADSYDALTSDRPYRRALTPDRAQAILRDERGTHFDPHLLDTFLAALTQHQDARPAA
jgi:HD-GYP domain-containing protein (c-di-GMP phosphodiesterase class II)